MAQEEQHSFEATVEPIATVQGNSNAPWAGLGFGLVGGVVGALAITLITPLFEADSQDTLTPQVEAHSAQITAQTTRFEQLDGHIDRLGKEIGELNANWEKVSMRFYETLMDMDDKIREFETKIEELEATTAQTASIGQSQATQAQDLTQATVNLRQELDAVKNRLSAFEASASSTPSPVAQENIDWSGDIAALKTQIDDLKRQLATFPPILQKLEAQQTQNSTLISDQNAAIASLNKDVDGIKLAPPASDRSLALLVAANSLKAAIERGGSYLNEWQVFATVAQATSLNFETELLEKYAESGLLNAAELSTRFTKLADEIAALDNELPEDAGITDQLLRQGSRLYTSRPVGEVEGDGAAAIAARMEVAIGQGDFARALNEAQKLPPEAKVLAADFLELLEARERVNGLLVSMVSTLLPEED